MRRAFAVAAILCTACLAEAPTDPPLAACPPTGPVLLAPPPDDWEDRPENYYSIHGPEDNTIVYSFGRSWWTLDLCGGEPEPYADASPHLREVLTSRNSASDPVTYAFDRILDTYVILNPDSDVPRTLVGLERGEHDIQIWGNHAVFLRAQHVGAELRGVAGLDASTWGAYSHNGDPDAPVVRLANGVVSGAWQGSHFIVLHGDGRVRAVDPITGEGELLLEGARHVAAYEDRLIWQAIGDDIAEPIYLRDLTSGDDLLLGVNDLCQRSWGRDEGVGASKVGSWTIRPPFAFQWGPEDTLLRAHMLDTGAALAIPEHRAARPMFTEFHLELDEPGLTLAFWDPASGAVQVWYRGTSANPPGTRYYDGDTLEYFVYEQPSLAVGSLWRFDRRTEETALVASGLHRSSYHQLDDGRYLTGVPDPAASQRFTSVVVRDLDTGTTTILATGVESFDVGEVDGADALVTLDVRGPEPGVWLRPIPAR